jgi:hypothetical protein
MLFVQIFLCMQLKLGNYSFLARKRHVVRYIVTDRENLSEDDNLCNFHHEDLKSDRMKLV